MASPIVMPSFGMYTAEGTLVSWLHPAGAAVREGDPVLEIETDKATQEVVAPASGFLHHLLEVGARLQEQTIVGYVLAEGEQPPVAIDRETTAEKAAVLPQAAPHSSTFVKATPMARRLAQEHGIQLHDVTPTGPGGRIVEKDVLAAVERRTSVSTAESGTPAYPWQVRERIPFRGMRRTIAERLKQSQNAAVSLTLTREVVVENLMGARLKLTNTVKHPIPVDAFFVMALALGLRDESQLNAVISADELLLLDEVNIGFAVALPNGIGVPVIHRADTLTVVEIAKRMNELIEVARNGRLKSGDIDGGTSTITNLGSYNIDSFTPVLNPPQATILGIGRIIDRAVVTGGNIVVKPSVWLSLTFDHRVADGAAAAKLLDAVVNHLTDHRFLAGHSGRS